MKLISIIKAHQKEIIHDWINAIFDSYPSDTAIFLKKETNQFSNPVGATFKNECPVLIDELLNHMNRDNLIPSLQKIAKIRAVQDYTPSQALDFLFHLKNLLYQKFKSTIKTNDLQEQFLELQQRVDELIKIGFDLFVSAKMKIAEVRVNEMKRQTAIIMERINQMFEHPEGLEDQEDNQINQKQDEGN